MRVMPGLGAGLVQRPAVRLALPTSLRKKRPTAVMPTQASAQPTRSATYNEHSTEHASLILPLNYAELMGLRGRELVLDPQITSVHDDLLARDLDAAYSSVARVGRTKILHSAREGLRAARGRVSLIHPDVSIDALLLPGALALLEQVGQYELVVQLSAGTKTGALPAADADQTTLQDFQRDVSLATALAHCGLAKGLLERKRFAAGSAKLEEALFTLQDGACDGAPLAADLQAKITAALADIKPEALLDFLGQPIDPSEATLRRQAVAALGKLMSEDKAGGVSEECVVNALRCLAADEIVGLVDWNRVAKRVMGGSGGISIVGGGKGKAAGGAAGWATPGMLAHAGLAHIVAGFVSRRPERIAAARGLLRAVSAETDVAVHLAVCDALLGQSEAALDALRQDERQGSGAGATPAALPHRARSALSAAAAAANLGFPERDGVMAFVRAASPQWEVDLQPGLTLFTEQWLHRLALPRFRHSRERQPLASLAAFFSDPAVEAYLDAKAAKAAGLTPAKAVEAFRRAALRLAASAKAQAAGMPAKRQAAYAGAGVAMTLAVALLGMQRGAASQQRFLSSQAPGGVAATTSPAAAAVRSSAKSATRAAASTQALSKDAALELITQWLGAKVDAMGPRHNTTKLSSVLAEPMLSAVTSEAAEAATSGWFWNIRPLHVRVTSIDESALTPQGEGHAVVVATVDESAELWATNGKKGDSYRSQYNVEYNVVRVGDGWRVASALVLGGR